MYLLSHILFKYITNSSYCSYVETYLIYFWGQRPIYTDIGYNVKKLIFTSVLYK